MVSMSTSPEETGLAPATDSNNCAGSSTAGDAENLSQKSGDALNRTGTKLAEERAVEQSLEMMISSIIANVDYWPAKKIHKCTSKVYV
eukprot:CAMPEP_0206403920 /NCGR_PEP_ID=MMETSP0294-20121207/28028_1 /ASSEMBLY_ACC=CAM_ASM_000327 /TAXON_ID=39354 /ORGANISM="Heterosigma akashiwo, Strain CCMP2393" /LENGTH=87 /DNA_ID=CAMNT_0053861655 /DNA_START=21 /DNA_END=282 /DNA_ORIENTATION=+